MGHSPVASALVALSLAVLAPCALAAPGFSDTLIGYRYSEVTTRSTISSIELPQTWACSTRERMEQHSSPHGHSVSELQ
jgi:hypothetical protein